MVLGGGGMVSDIVLLNWQFLWMNKNGKMWFLLLTMVWWLAIKYKKNKHGSTVEQMCGEWLNYFECKILSTLSNIPVFWALMIKISNL